MSPSVGITPEYLSTTQTARCFGLSADTLTELASCGAIRRIRKGPSKKSPWLYDYESLKRLLDSIPPDGAIDIDAIRAGKVLDL